MGQIENLVDKMSTEKQSYPSKCGNKKCPNHDGSESGCLRYSKWTVDMCGEFHSELNLLLSDEEILTSAYHHGIIGLGWYEVVQKSFGYSMELASEAENTMRFARDILGR